MWPGNVRLGMVRRTRTVGEFKAMTPEEKKADAAKFWREFAAVYYDINRIGEDDETTHQPSVR
jgi:hypothetical protein